MTQTEIAQQLGYDQSTISDDVKALRVMSHRFIYDLAKSDLAFYYKQCLDGIEEAKKEAWRIYDDKKWDSHDAQKIKLMALKVAIQAEEAKFKLLNEGPNVLAINAMSQRLETLGKTIEQEVNR
jgi:transcriptional regulator with XRE-family HTH domain